MNYHAKRKLARSSMYIVLALSICTVMCLTIVAFVGAQRPKDRTDPAHPDVLTPEDSSPSDGSSVTPPEEENNKAPDKPEDNKTDLPSDGSDTPDKPTGSEGGVDYVLPADGYVLKGFSVDLPVWSMTMEDYRAHTGIDVSAACGSAVYAMTGGIITDISEDPLMGVSMTVIQDDGNTALYQNLSAELPSGIEEGTTVTAGQVIASVGDTAMIEQCETDHLHLEIFTATGERVNPESLLDFSKVPQTDSGNE